MPCDSNGNFGTYEYCDGHQTTDDGFEPTWWLSAFVTNYLSGDQDLDPYAATNTCQPQK